MSDERRATAEGFAELIRESGLSVELEITGYKPGRRALTPVEWTAIFIGTNVATGLVSNLTNDLYQAAKRMLTTRRHAKERAGQPRRQLGFVIYGPDGEELRRWTTAETEDKDVDDPESVPPEVRRDG
jgi:hypothetical protein